MNTPELSTITPSPKGQPMTTTISTENDTPNAGKGMPAFLARHRDGCYPALPGPLATSVEALRKLDAMILRDAQQAQVSLSQFCTSVTDAALEGQGFPDDFAAAAHAAQVAEERQATGSATLQSVHRQVTSRLPQIITANLDGLLDGLRTELQSTLDAARLADADLTGLDPANADAIAAATTKQRSAVTSLGDLRPRYNRVRTAQKAALEASDRHVVGWSAWSAGHTWADVWASGLHEHRNGSSPKATGPLTARFLETIRRTDIWMPSMDELEAAWAAAKPSHPSHNTTQKESA